MTNEHPFFTGLGSPPHLSSILGARGLACALENNRVWKAPPALNLLNEPALERSINGLIA